MSEEPLTLVELQIAKNTLETKARRLRERLRELASTRAAGWKAEFPRLQDELIEVTARIGRIDKRICKLVEREIVTEKE